MSLSCNFKFFDSSTSRLKHVCEVFVAVSRFRSYVGLDFNAGQFRYEYRYSLCGLCRDGTIIELTKHCREDLSTAKEFFNAAIALSERYPANDDPRDCDINSAPLCVRDDIYKEPPDCLNLDCAKDGAILVFDKEKLIIKEAENSEP